MEKAIGFYMPTTLRTNPIMSGICVDTPISVKCSDLKGQFTPATDESFVVEGGKTIPTVQSSFG